MAVICLGTLNDVFWEGRVVVAKTGNLMTDRHNYTGKLINLCKLVVFSPKKKKKRERDKDNDNACIIRLL